MNLTALVQYVKNCMWLLAPVMALNVLFSSELPLGYQPSIFWKDIPAPLTVAENGLRIALFAVPACIPLGWSTRAQRLGLVIFALGFVMYALSWAWLICYPHGAIARSAWGFTSPAWTPAGWLAGLVVVAETSFFPWFRPRKTMLVLAAAFLVCHISHAALVYSRLY